MKPPNIIAIAEQLRREDPALGFTESMNRAEDAVRSGRVVDSAALAAAPRPVVRSEVAPAPAADPMRAEIDALRAERDRLRAIAGKPSGRKLSAPAAVAPRGAVVLELRAGEDRATFMRRCERELVARGRTPSQARRDLRAAINLATPIGGPDAA